MKEKLSDQGAFEASLMICTALREVRKAQCLSQSELGFILGIDQQTVAKMENRKFSIGIDKLIQWMHALDVNIELHMKGQGNPEIEKAFSQLGRRPDDLPRN
jgi:transcriptional regulator with XRE-family HTH domain